MLFTAARTYVRYVDALNRFVGRCVMYLVFVIMGILLFSALSRFVFDKPVLWGNEMAQFITTAYYMLGGGFALLINAHARMDVFYSRLSIRKKAAVDSVTIICLVVFLGFLLYGGISSTAYSLEYNQHNNTAWGPSIAPIKVFMVIGTVLTLLQTISEFFKDLARAHGVVLAESIPELVLIEANSVEKSRAETEAPRIPASPAAAPGLTPSHA